MALILVADDDKDIRELVRMQLTNWGHEVVTAADGEEALDALEQHPVDLAMVDLVMPRLMGNDVVRQIRAYENEEHLEALPIIMMSGSTRPIDIAKSYDVGADEYLVKPFRMSNLVAVVGAMAPTLEAVQEPVEETRYSA